MFRVSVTTQGRTQYFIADSWYDFCDRKWRDETDLEKEKKKEG